MRDDEIKEIIRIFEEGSEQIKEIIDVINKYLVAIKEVKSASINIEDMVSKIPTLDNDVVMLSLKQIAEGLDQFEHKLIKKIETYHREDNIVLKRILDEQLQLKLALGSPGGIKADKTKQPGPKKETNTKATKVNSKTKNKPQKTTTQESEGTK